ncbi:MAG: ABC transporter permease [Paracoccaceae bacterium]
MFQSSRRKSGLGSALALSELIYHSIVRSVRKSHGNALMAIATNVLQSIIMVMVFYLMFSILGLRGSALRGDFLLYIMTGIFLFMTHTKVVGAVVGAEGPASPMMNHAPMNTVVAISAAALGSLYIQLVSLFVILFVYHVAVTPVVIDQPIGAFGMLLLSWFTGVAIGLVFLAAKPWFPGFVAIAVIIFQRANMLASGKMFVVNSMPSFMLAMFDWNPLFHTIDQARGFTFINYYPRHTSTEYPLYVGLALLMIGLMGEYYTRHRASLSWSARL